MGLDITAYRKLTAAPDAKLDSDGSPEDWDTHVQIGGSILAWTEKEWPGRTKGITEGVYSFAEKYGFRAGSYGGYNVWRSWLAKMGGWGSAEECWASDKTSGPFYELIHFADNEGVIGPEVSAKLAKDFADNEERVSQIAEDYDLQRYRDWRKAFEMAADGGAVDFH